MTVITRTELTCTVCMIVYVYLNIYSHAEQCISCSTICKKRACITSPACMYILCITLYCILTQPKILLQQCICSTYVSMCVCIRSFAMILTMLIDVLIGCSQIIVTVMTPGQSYLSYFTLIFFHIVSISSN